VIGDDNDLYSMCSANSPARSSIWAATSKPSRISTARSRSRTAKLGAGHVQSLTIMVTKCDALHAAGSLRERSRRAFAR